MTDRKLWLLTIEALDAGNNPVVLRFASGDYTDNLGNYYDLRIEQPAIYTAGAYTGPLVPFTTSTNYGETVLINTDGGLDYLADYAVDGRMTRLSLITDIGLEDIIVGTVESISFENEIVSVRLRSPEEILNNLHPKSEYLGNNVLPNGLEGLPDTIQGSVKPKVYGSVVNAEPVQVNTSRLIYQFHDFSITDAVTVPVNLTNVYDRGVALTAGTTHTTVSNFYSIAPSAGTYSIYNGYFRLGSTPSGTVTFDAVSNVNKIGSVFQLIAEEAGFSCVQDNIDDIDFSLYVAGYYMKEAVTTLEVLNLISESACAFWTINRDGVIEIKEYSSATGALSTDGSVLSISDSQILSISRTSTGAGSNGVPIYKLLLRADKVELVQTDLAGSVSADRVSRLSKEYREAISENSATKTRHILSEEISIDTVFRSLSAAQSTADRVRSFFGSRRDSVQLEVRLDEDIIPNLKIGRVITLTCMKLGYSVPRNFIILGFELEARLGKVILKLFG